MNKEGLGHASIFSANLIYGANYSIAKLVMPLYIPPMGFIVLRVLGATLLFWIVSIFFPQKLERQDYKRMALCGIFGVAINQLMFFKGLNLTTPINASIIMICTPILVLIISNLLLKEKITFTKIIGLSLGIAGAMVLILKGRSVNFGSGTAWGDFFILINATSFGAYLVLAKPLIKKYSVLTISKWIFLIGSVFVLPFGTNELLAVQWHTFTPLIWSSTIFVVVGVTFFAYLFNNYGLKVLSPNIVSFYIYLQPFLAAFIAISIGKDQLNLTKILSAILIFTGVYFISKKQKPL